MQENYLQKMIKKIPQKKDQNPLFLPLSPFWPRRSPPPPLPSRPAQAAAQLGSPELPY